MAVFFRIEVDVIKVMLIVEVVADQGFPITALPNTPFAAGFECGSAWFGAGEAFGESKFDHLPAQGKIGVACGQCPEAVHVLGQNHPSVDMEGVSRLGCANRGAQQINFPHQ